MIFTKKRSAVTFSVWNKVHETECKNQTPLEPGKELRAKVLRKDEKIEENETKACTKFYETKNHKKLEKGQKILKKKGFCWQT